MFSRFLPQKTKTLKTGRFMSLLHQPASSDAGATVEPLLRRAMEDGSEEDLYRYTRYRWLSNEQAKLDMRYRKFNLNGLLTEAVKSVGNGAKSCVKVLKCVEGQFNKVFILTMDNAAELVVKIPNPNAGPEFYTTASEVATRDFLRDVLNIPTPRILASSSTSANIVGAEYILEEKADGKQLGNLWYKWPKEARLEIIQQLVDIEVKLGALSFLKHGCIYYKSDLESKGFACESLAANLSRVHNSSSSKAQRLNLSKLEDFAVGPLTDARLWEGEKATMNLDRGPWNTAAGYMLAMGSNEILWTKSHARPRMNFHRSMEHPEVPNDYISLLERYIALAPYLVPASAKEEDGGSKTISHPDLHLDNIFVDPDTWKITNVIDWQSACIREQCMQSAFPQMLAPLSASGSNGRNDAGQKVGDDKPQDLDLLTYYQKLLKKNMPRRWEALNEKHLSIRTKPTSLVSGCWLRDDIFSFRHSLINVIAHWGDLASAPSSKPSYPCPAEFTDEELERHRSEMDIIEGLSTVMHQLQDEDLIPVGGMVQRDDYEQARELNRRFRQMFIDLAEDDHQRELHSKVWPYQEV
ncbi:Phosphotransferase enzyme [Arachnomyces sp. PD_36]|nr:Phosphotransferase enzyme [Arachnomyces sp. PD_36]